MSNILNLCDESNFAVVSLVEWLVMVDKQGRNVLQNCTDLRLLSFV